MELPTSSCHGVPHPRYYRFVGNFSRKSPGWLPRGEPEEDYYRVLGYGGDVKEVGTGDWNLMPYSSSLLTRGQNTHTTTTTTCTINWPLCPTWPFRSHIQHIHSSRPQPQLQTRPHPPPCWAGRRRRTRSGRRCAPRAPPSNCRYRRSPPR